jgi:hypothetical protein
MRAWLFRSGAVALIALAVALIAISPTEVRYWIVLGIVSWAVAPYLGATGLPVMVIRHGAVFLAVVVGIPFTVSSPQHRTFWALLGALLVVLLPFAWAMGWFYGQIRRLQRERRIVSGE